MASRKKTPDANQLGLVSPPTTKPLTSPKASTAKPDRDGEPVDLDEFDDYDEPLDAPILRLVDPPRPAPRVVVEALGEDRFEVSRLRDNGTTVASVMWTRDELAELIGRAASALKM